jgi:hypothetical protein
MVFRWARNNASWARDRGHGRERRDVAGDDQTNSAEAARWRSLASSPSRSRHQRAIMRRQSQSSGDNSTQVQAAGDVVVGVSESRAREIAEATSRAVVAEFAEEGARLIQDRITRLDDRVIASLIRAGRLEVFADPGFQRSYKKAQEGAAVSDKDGDYDLLAGLLADRAMRGPDRRVRAGIERSIEIVDQIDDEALRGLTIFQAIQQYRPLAPGLDDGLDAMDGLFADLLDGPLPDGPGWIDHLDILDAVRVNQVSSLLPFREYYPTRMAGYLASGMPTSVMAWPFENDGAVHSHPNLLMPHELRPGFTRFAAANSETLAHTFPVDGGLRSAILDQAREKLGFETVDPTLVDPFLERLRERPALSQIESWWGQIPQALQVTGVGRVLARANALRLDVRHVLPPID